MSDPTYIRNGDTVTPATFQDHWKNLPVGVYALNYNQFTGFYLTIKEEGFTMPPKIYGSTGFPDRILSTYHKLEKGMSVLLSGPKGTGKTVDAKMTCLQSNMPVILISTAHAGDALTNFIDKIQTPSIFFIDEFEKVYDDESDRNYFLTIMDGVSKSRHLFILTSNNDDIGQFFESRPGRVRYHRHYDCVTDEVIREVIFDKLVDHGKLDEITNYVMGLSEVSIDSLTCIIEECNLYGEVPEQFMSFFNVRNIPIEYYRCTTSLHEAIPKKGIKGKMLKIAEQKARYANEYDEQEDDFDKYCEMKLVEYNAEFASPFDARRENIAFNATMYSTESGSGRRGGYGGKGVTIYQSDVKSFANSRKGFRLETTDGQVIVGTPNKSARHNKFAF